MLVACNDKVPDECDIVFNIMDTSERKLEERGYQSEYQRERYEKEKDYLKQYINTLSIFKDNERTEICKELSKVYQSRIEQLNKAKSEKDFNYIFYNDEQRMKMFKKFK